MERLTSPSLTVSSESAGNTVAAPESAALAQTAPGGESILPPSPTSDVVLDTAGGRVDDYARLVTDAGEPGARPGEGGPWTTEYQDSPPWRQT